MTWISNTVTVTGLILLAHACYSAQEHSVISSTAVHHGQPQPLATHSLPIDISIEALIATLIVVLGLVLGTPKLRPIKWHEWAGRIEREGEAGFQTGSGEVEKDYRGNPFSVLETRPGFIDIRKQRREFTSWVKAEEKTPGSSASSSSRRGRGRRGRSWRGRTYNRGRSAGPSSRGGTTRQRARPRQTVSNHYESGSSPNTSSSIRFSPASQNQGQYSDPREPQTPNANIRARSSSEPIQHEVVMAIDLKENSTIGCAYFSTTDGVLHISEDIASASLDIAEQFLIHGQPTSLLVSARAPASFRDHLENITTPEGALGGVIFRGLQSSEFSTETAHERLFGLDSHILSSTGIVFSTGVEDDATEESIPGLSQPESHAFRELRYGGCINMNSQVSVSVGCTGALLGDILRRRSAGFLPDGQVAGVLFRVANIRMFSLSTYIYEESKARHRSSVRTGIDPQLDELKRRYDGMDSFLTEVVNHVNRFLTVVESNPLTGNGQYEGEGTAVGAWEKLFTADSAVCYKNSYMRELDDEYGDMYCQIGDREVEIIYGLAGKVMEHEEPLLLASDMCGEFDAVLALALGAEKYDWRAPQMVEASIINIEEGRHPLQELVVPAFIPNPCHLFTGRSDITAVQDDCPQALVLTGPNHSGKSVYLKQTAIIVYLAHIGSFVPADQAIIGLTESILTCISPRESMSGGESAFARDMKQAALSAKSSTPKSLVLIDEFGKGTNGDNGAGLLAALLDYYLSLGPKCPRLLAATHFHEVFESGYLEHHNGLRIAHMNTRMDWDASLVDDQVTYLFNLEYGHSISSLGSRCAALNGIPSAVVERAENISKLLARNEDLSAVCARLSRAEEEQLEKAEMTARLFLSETFGDQDEDNSTREENTRVSIIEMLEDILSPNI
ncbi:DNA mismatch repair MSH5 [Fusarium beomiforme]|uniref:DNA mismatch repair protein MSH5 n=1 Tax=Fusarium beomiforme TaxID=44412 RepID=A0A9P5A5Z6_9HYPO|nr:DNA mismatch repair MSH5 [Fusarium beomiforme]